MAAVGTIFPYAPVVVVGGGYAGLSAAIALHDRGIRAQVLEASGNVGGRAFSELRSGAVVDHGGQWIGQTQKRLLAWSERFDCPTFPTWDTGDHLEIWQDGAPRRFTHDGPENAPGIQGYLDAVQELDRLASYIQLDDPASTPQINDWDTQTAQSFFETSVASHAARRRLALAVQGVWSCEPRDVSLFHLLFYIASAGGFSQLMDTRQGAQELRFLSGAQAPALAAADYLGDAVHLGTPVVSIEHSQQSVLIHTPQGSIEAEHAIVATPPHAIASVEFTPPLPNARRQWIEQSPMGDVAKVHVIYDRPFWREAGLSGQAVIYGDDAVGVVFDNSPDTLEAGVLVAFIYGDRFHIWARRSDDERRASVLATLAKLFGAQANDINDYTEKLWPMDHWIGGGYAAVPRPGAWLEHAKSGWRAPNGRIHWAGSETATTWNGYIDGAISSGERAAEEVRICLEKRRVFR